MTEVIDVRKLASELFTTAAEQIVEASPQAMDGPQRLMPRLLQAADDDAEFRARILELGETIAGEARAFVMELGERDLVDDLGTLGFVVCAALAFAIEPPADDLADDELPR